MTDQTPNPSPLPLEGNPSRAAPAAAPSEHSSALISARNALFLSLVVVSAAVFWTPLRILLDYSLRGGHQYDQYSHTLLIPLVSIALAYSERKPIFASVRYAFPAGGMLLLTSLTLDWFGRRTLGATRSEVSLSITILGVVIFWMGAFVVCYGRQAFRAGSFALLFLLLTVPVPTALLNGPVTFVQQGSADTASLMFQMFGVPVFRSGLFFTLPGLTIEIAKECSGIHSILALFILSLLAGHLSRLAGLKRLILALLVFPIVCLTNGLRIGALALLSAYVDPRIINSSLHRDGGILFFLLGLGLLMSCLHWIRKVKLPGRAREGVMK